MLLSILSVVFINQLSKNNEAESIRGSVNLEESIPKLETETIPDQKNTSTNDTEPETSNNESGIDSEDEEE